jgi:hypothetical protein
MAVSNNASHSCKNEKEIKITVRQGEKEETRKKEQIKRKEEHN